MKNTFKESRSWAWLLGGVCLLGLGLRWYHIGAESVWYDEIFAITVSHMSWRPMLGALVEDVVHPPLHYFLLHIWMGIFGSTPGAARALSAVCGVLSIPALYALARCWYDRGTSLLASLLLAVSQLGVMYSQEARPYELFLLLFLLSCVAFILALRKISLGGWITFLVCACLLTYTHYYGFLALAALCVFAWLYRRTYRLPATWWWAGGAALAAAYLPWLDSGIVAEVLGGHKVSGPLAVPLARFRLSPISALASLANAFNNGRVNGLQGNAPLWAYAAGTALITAPAVIAVLHAFRQKGKRGDGASQPTDGSEAAVFLCATIAVPILLAILAGIRLGFYDIRYVAFCAAPYYVLVADGISELRAEALRTALVVAILGYSGYALRSNYRLHYKEDYKSTYAALEPQLAAGDCVVVAQSWQDREARWAWAIYEPNRPALPETSLDAAASCKRVWMLSVEFRGDALAKRIANEVRGKLAQTHSMVEQRRFFWITLDRYE